MSQRSRANSTPPPAASFAAGPRWIAVALVVIGTVVIYGPALSGGLLWDDAGHVTRPDLRTLGGLARIWFDLGATQQYYPLLHSAFWLEHQFWGNTTLGYHLVNVGLHATAALLFGTLLRRLAVPGAWLAALLFAFHPVCVESVAWISEQKNTLSAVLTLSAALAYWRFHDTQSHPSPSRGSYVLATLLFVFALLTKTVTATLPAALLVVIWWKSTRLVFRRDVLPLLPWFALSIVAGLFTAHVERTLIGAQGEAFELSFIERLLVAGRAPWFYLGKLLWPANLVFIYPRWTPDPAALWQWLYPVATVIALATAFYLSRTRMWGRGLLATMLLFGGMLFPVLGFFNVYPFIYSFVADHFQYLASLPVFALAAASLSFLSARLLSPVWRSVGAAGLIVALGALSWRQAHMYRDVTTLWETTIARNPSCWMAHTNLGVLLADAGRFDEAVAHHRRALELHSGYAEAHNNLGYALSALGQREEALPHFQRALELRPNYSQAFNNLADALMMLGRHEEGLAAFREAIRHHPGFASAHFNLGLALARMNRTDEALPCFRRALELDPSHVDAELSLATGLMLTNKLSEAMPHFARALTLDPNSPNGHYAYGRALVTQGRYDDAIHHFREAVDLAPDFAMAHQQLAQALRQTGQLELARHHLQQAQRPGPSPSNRQ